MAVNGLDVAGNLISLLIALMHKRPIANLMACSRWVIEVGLIGRIGRGLTEEEVCERLHLLKWGTDLLWMANHYRPSEGGREGARKQMADWIIFSPVYYRGTNFLLHILPLVNETVTMIVATKKVLHLPSHLLWLVTTLPPGGCSLYTSVCLLQGGIQIIKWTLKKNWALTERNPLCRSLFLLSTLCKHL